MAFCWFSAAISDLIANIAGILYNILGNCPDRSDIFWLVPHPKKEENYMAFDGMVVANLTCEDTSEADRRQDQQNRSARKG